MPTAFTPNDDGLNDVIKRYTQNVSSINFVVYDGNNNVVFSTTQINQSWSTTGGSNLLGLVPRSSASPLGLSVGCE